MQMKGQGGRVVGALALHYLLYTFLGVMGVGALIHFHKMADNTTNTGTSGSANLPNGLNVTLPKGLSSSQYLLKAENDATQYNYNPILFVRQIYVESHFDPNAISPAGAAGIAQFMPGTAPCWGIHVDNSQNDIPPPGFGKCVNNSQNDIPIPHPCSLDGLKNTLKLYLCDERFDPVLSLDGAADMMSTSYYSYLGSGTSAQDQIEAYKKALADYNCGCVGNSIKQGGVDWEQYLPTETKNYIFKIMYGSL